MHRLLSYKHCMLSYFSYSKKKKCKYTWYSNLDIKTNLRQTEHESVDCIHLAQDRDKWQTLVNMATNLRIHKKNGEFFDQLSDY